MYLSHAEKNQEESALKWYRLAANQGDSEAQRLLGVCYECGNGVPQDYVEAAKWYRLSAEQGNIYGLKRLADCYRYGHGVKESRTEAIKLYSKAAAQGDDYAKCQLKALEL